MNRPDITATEQALFFDDPAPGPQDVVARIIDGAPCYIPGCKDTAQGAVFFQFGPDDDPDALHFFCRKHLNAVCR